MPLKRRIKQAATGERRRRPENVKERIVREREYENIQLVSEHGFPVLEQTLNKTSWDTRYEISEVVSVEHTTPATELFTIPGDYRRRSFMDMIGGQGGG